MKAKFMRFERGTLPGTGLGKDTIPFIENLSLFSLY